MGMGGLSNRRRLKAAGAFFLIALWALHPLLPLLAAHPAHDHAGTEIEASRIDIGEGTVFCEHHAEGCPKDCMCPKITRPEPDRAELTGTVLKHCSAGEAHATLASLMVSLPAFLPEWSWNPESGSAHPGLPPGNLLEPYALSPLKVPIA